MTVLMVLPSTLHIIRLIIEIERGTRRKNPPRRTNRHFKLTTATSNSTATTVVGIGRGTRATIVVRSTSSRTRNSISKQSSIANVPSSPVQNSSVAFWIHLKLITIVFKTKSVFVQTFSDWWWSSASPSSFGRYVHRKEVA